jgi:hypothetical protein
MRLLRYLPRYHRKYRHFGRLVTDGGGSERMVPIGAVADEFNRATHHGRFGLFSPLPDDHRLIFVNRDETD